MDPYPRTWAEVDLSALAHNLSQLRLRMDDPAVQVALVSKADGYGHGLVPVTRYALRHGADWAAVATVQEGIALRDAGIDNPIMCMSPMLSVEAEQAVYYSLDVLVENLETAQALSAAATKYGRPARLHLEVDTGIHRFGCVPEEAVSLAGSVRGLPGVSLVGIAQHFADSSRDDAKTRCQLSLFAEVLADAEAAGIQFEVVHMANSAGAVKYPASRGDLVRVGIVAYGIDPYGLLQGQARPVMRWTARLTSLRRVPSGSSIGYAGTHVVSRPSVIGTVGVGYGDGYPRSLSNRGVVAVHGLEAPVVGLVCMDQLLIDLTDVPGVTIGDAVTLLGDGVTCERLATLCETNVHEIVTRIMSRVPRRYLHSAD